MSLTASFTMSGLVAGLLNRIGIEALEPRPTDSVSRANEMIAGTSPPTVTTELFDTIAALVAVTVSVPLATPVTRPVLSTVVMAGFVAVKVNVPPEM